MAVDTPARIVILGAGPIGVEAALYARFLGYEVEVYERDSVGATLARWGKRAFWTRFADVATPLGVAALEAQGAAKKLPPADAFCTAREYLERYLRPLAESDLLDGLIRTGWEVLGVAREDLHKSDLIGDSRRDDSGFLVLVQDANGRRKFVSADVVIDATGAAIPLGLGPGGLPAIGEAESLDRVAYHAVDALGAERATYAKRTTLVVGTTLEAAQAVVDLAQLATEEPGTEVIWCSYGPGAAATSDRPPVAPIADDPLPKRVELIRAADALANGAHPAVKFQHASIVERLSVNSEGRVDVVFRPTPPQEEDPEKTAPSPDADALDKEPDVPSEGREEGPTIVVDRVLALAGKRPNFEFLRELPLSFDRATDATPGVVEQLRESPGQWPPRFGAERVTTAEMDFYVLGAKSFGRTGLDTIRAGLDQVRAVFAIVGDRADLDLNLTAGKALREGK